MNQEENSTPQPRLTPFQIQNYEIAFKKQVFDFLEGVLHRRVLTEKCIFGEMVETPITFDPETMEMVPAGLRFNQNAVKSRERKKLSIERAKKMKFINSKLKHYKPHDNLTLGLCAEELVEYNDLHQKTFDDAIEFGEYNPYTKVEKRIVSNIFQGQENENVRLIHERMLEQIRVREEELLNDYYDLNKNE